MVLRGKTATSLTVIKRLALPHREFEAPSMNMTHAKLVQRAWRASSVCSELEKKQKQNKKFEKEKNKNKTHP